MPTDVRQYQSIKSTVLSTTNLNFTTSGADVTQQLITALAPLGSTDTVVVHFGAGTFHISNAVVFGLPIQNICIQL